MLISLGLAKHHTRISAGKIQLFARTRNSHIAQPPFLFQILIGIAAHFAWKNPLLKADEEHIIKFQPFSCVHCHQNDHIGLIIIAVNIADQRNLFQEPFQRSFRTPLISICFHTGNQLANIFQTCLTFLARQFQHGPIPCNVQQFCYKGIQRQRFICFYQLFVNTVKLLQSAGRAPKSGVFTAMLDNIQHRYSQPACNIRRILNSSRSNFSCRLINDSAKAQIILSIGNNGHVRNNIFDFLAVIKALPAYNFIRNARTGKIGLNRS